MNTYISQLLPVLVAAIPTSYIYSLVLNFAKTLPAVPSKYIGVIGDGVAIVAGVAYIGLNGPQTWQAYLTGAVAGLIVSLGATGLYSRSATITTTGKPVPVIGPPAA